MTEITKIVLTGGPCGGKTTAMDYLKEALNEYGVMTFCVPEQAERLIKSGKTPDNMGRYDFHALLFENQLKNEADAEAAARACSAKKALVLCDRGLLDSRAYVSADEFERYAGAHSLNEARIRNRYDAVMHMVTAADGAEEYYTLKNNSARSETPEHARRLDSDILSLWVGTEHLRIIANDGSFENKLKKLLDEALAVLGIPEPLEIERKFLIEYPDIKLLNDMKTCRRVAITQAYMNTPEEGLFRVRQRGEGEDALYIKTVKRKINDIKRIEIENYISLEEYNSYLTRTDCVQGVISKDRYCIAYNGGYYELDVYPFWRDRATLELELLSEDQEVKLPDFINLIRDVSFEKAYRNKRLAVTYAKFFSR